jgi:hypothetical protein
MNTLHINYNYQPNYRFQSRISNFDNNNNNNNVVDPLLKYKQSIQTALNTSRTLYYFNNNIDYDNDTKTFTAFLPELISSTSQEVNIISILDKTTGTYIENSQDIQYSYDTQNNKISITIPSFDNSYSILMNVIGDMANNLKVEYKLRYI